MAWASRASSATRFLSASIGPILPSSERSLVWVWGSTLWQKSSRAMGEPSWSTARLEKDRPLRSPFPQGGMPERGKDATHVIGAGEGGEIQYIAAGHEIAVVDNMWAEGG